VTNPAAFTHASVAILDALNAFEATVISPHLERSSAGISPPSYVSLRADGVIAGLSGVYAGAVACAFAR
jgi:3-dehydroquinate dehydratase-2